MHSRRLTMLPTLFLNPDISNAPASARTWAWPYTPIVPVTYEAITEITGSQGPCFIKSLETMVSSNYLRQIPIFDILHVGRLLETYYSPVGDREKSLSTAQLQEGMRETL